MGGESGDAADGMTQAQPLARDGAKRSVGQVSACVPSPAGFPAANRVRAQG